MAVEITEDFVWQAIPPRPRESHKGTDLFFHVLHFLVEHPGGHAQCAVAKDDDLLHAV